jgi:hypothetical protein
MNLRSLHHAVLVTLFAVAPVALAQTGAAQGGTGNAATTSTAPGGGHDASMSHDGTHRTAGNSHKSARSATASHVTNGNLEYEAALRRCVQMSGDGRERCLDDAIARYGS